MSATELATGGARKGRAPCVLLRSHSGAYKQAAGRRKTPSRDHARRELVWTDDRRRNRRCGRKACAGSNAGSGAAERPARVRTRVVVTQQRFEIAARTDV
eukprot:535889-Rhodomonas_salina.1